MRIHRTLRSLAALLPCTILAPPLAAQAIAGSFSPNPAMPGEEITFTATDATGQGFTVYMCGWYRIHAGTPDGPVLPVGGPCVTLAWRLVAPNGSTSVVWDQTLDHDPAQVPVPPGTYWFEILTNDPLLGPERSDFFCLFIQDPLAPALRQSGPVRVGSSTRLELSSPSDPFALYALAASWTSNRPLRGLGVPLCLSPDSLLDLSLARPSGLFARGAGFLDATGRAPGLALRIPDIPALAYRGFHVQALLGTSTGLEVTNDLSLTILP